MALNEGQSAVLRGTLVSAVFDLDADRASIAGIGQGRKELAPIDFTHTGKLGEVLIVGVGKDAKIIQQVLVNADILGMHVKQLVGEFSHRFQVIHVLEDQVRRIVIQAEVIAGNVVEHPPPDRGTACQVLSARPFVGGE